MPQTPTIFAIHREAATLASLQLVASGLGYRFESYASSEAFWAVKDAGKAGCLVLDVDMAGDAGEELFDRLCMAGFCWPTIALTKQSDLSLAVRMVKKGVFDFLQMPISVDQLKTLIHGAVKQDRQQRQAAEKAAGLLEQLNSLTDQHKSILRLLRSGASSREIAVSLDVSLRTVQIKRAQIAKLFGIQGRAGWNKLIAAILHLVF